MLLLYTLILIVLSLFQFKLPETELEKLLSAETEDVQRSILDNYAKDLPIVTR